MLGKTFKEHREAKGATQSEAAAATRLKMQHIQALEDEDFSTIAASAYAKGFIKLYAEYLEIDSAPLLADYEENFMPKRRQPLLSETEDHQPPKPPKPPREPREKSERDWSMPALPSFQNIEWPFTFSKKIAGIVSGSVLAAILLLFVISSVLNRESDSVSEPVADAVEERPVDVTLFRSHVLIKNPPEPYIDNYIDPQIQSSL